MFTRNSVSVISRLFLSFLFLILFSVFSEAAIFNCNTGDVTCLINSINSANDEVTNPGMDTINLDGSTFTLITDNNLLVGPNGLPVIETEIVINGNGSTVERSGVVGTPDFRIFYISDPNGNLTLNNLVIRGGLVESDPGGAIYNRGILTINGSTITDNVTKDEEPAGTAGTDSGDGGGIFNDSIAQLTIDNSTISNNKTGQGSQATGNLFQGTGGSGGIGGGIANRGTMTMKNSTVSGNSTGDGGLGRDDGGNGGCGGGIANLGNLTLANSTVSGNSTGDGGDNLSTDFGDTPGDGGDGGGVCNSGSAAAATIINSTIANNSVGVRGEGPAFLGFDGQGGELANVNSASMTVSNSIAAENVIVSTTDNCLGTITDGGSNLSDDSSCGFTGDNILGINLGPLANNGGFTETHALLAGSVAIDNGDNTICSNPPINGVDQRGVVRDANCDIGAFEGVSAPPPLEFNCSLGDVQCLIIAINDANNEVINPGLDTINLDGSIFTLISENNEFGFEGPNGLPTIQSEIVINGNGSTIERSDAGSTPQFRIFFIEDSGGDLTLNNVIITGGLSGEVDGNVDGEPGGGIYNSGVLTINESSIIDNTTSNGGDGGGIIGWGGFGGGIFNSSTGQLTVNNSNISNNNTGNGGNSLNPIIGTAGAGGFGAGIANWGTMTMTKSTVSGNSTGDGGNGTDDGGIGGRGGGIANLGSMTISNSTVSGNSTGDGGDGSNIDGGDGGNGGGIYNSGTGVTGSIINVTVTDNSVGIGGAGPGSNGADGDGAGLANVNSATLTASNSILADNDTSSGANNCLGTITDGGSNLSDDSTCGFSGDNTPNINLDTLADNGGLTETHAVFAGSAAIDAGNNATCSSPPVNGVDQRDFPRDASCDIGAYEAVSTGTIEIMKITNPIGGTGFDFVGTGFPAGCGLDSFTLDDSGSESCFVAVGNYTVQETNLPAGWVVSDIDCLGSSSFSVNVDTLTINLAADEDVVCRFTNELPSQAVSSLMEDVEELQLSQGNENSLLSKLDSAQKSILSNNIIAASNKLNAFINQVEDFNIEGIIADPDANQLIGVAQQIINEL